MGDRYMVSWREVDAEVTRVANTWRGRVKRVYGVPRGGCTPAAMLAERLDIEILDQSMQVAPDTLVVDDLVDSGATAARWAGYGHPHFDALFRKPHSPAGEAMTAREIDAWIVFPWEQHTGEAEGPVDAVTRLLEHIGEDPSREGLADTPGRVLRALTEMTSGYDVDVESLLTRTFESDGYGGLVVVTGVDFVSMCEHHMLPFTGTATVGYIPGRGPALDDDGLHHAPSRVVGLSKLARLVDVYARRLQVQERMTEQIADAIETHLGPEGIGVVIRATHSCLSCRGARKANAEMVTSSLRGALYEKPEARAEFMAIARPAG